MPPLEPAQSPGFLLWHAALRWQRHIVAALAPLDLTHVQFVLLASTWWLNEHGREPTQVALAGHAGTDIKMTSQVIRALERKGLVRRTVDPVDTRARRLAVTAAGAALAPRAITAVESADAAFFSGVEPRRLLSVLSALADFGSGPASGSRLAPGGPAEPG
ncbi:MAG TPA: MarR family winged helix-turn-helix transcriptional regulator [Solirubrobacteraceae bacterium]|nr:MarR family winged helix-turn-helix transcriptional regulator [Solirubrobacteraceae bacterium]